ncbi:MAG: HIT family protein [Myxococcales bacterium]
MNGCLECEAQRSGVPEVLHREGGFVVHAIIGGGAVPGWLIVAPERHVEQLDALEDAEAAALGPLLKKVGAALRLASGAEKLYVSVFAELVAHLHVHVIARTPELPNELRGARLFLSSEKAPADEVARVVQRVKAALSTQSSASDG